jgi:hypothetical protein
MKSKIVWLPAIVAILAAPSQLRAQYFGQNQVIYDSPEFEVLRTDHFDIYYYAEEGGAVEYAALMAERWYARLSRLLDHELSDRQPLILYASGPQFRQSNVIQGSTGEGTGGVTEILKRRIVIPFAGPLAETDHVIGHELVHAFQFDMTGEGGGRARSGIPSATRYPLWFVEGMAEYLSLGPDDPNTAMWMRDAVREDLPDLRRLEETRFFPYRYGQAVWAYIAGLRGDEVVGRILKAGRRSGLRGAMGQILGMSADSVVELWRQETRATYEPLQATTESPDVYGRLVVEDTTQDHTYNLAPALSPDGTQLVFLSSRELFSIDMFLTKVQPGGKLKRIVRTDIDPHFESIQFINSAGAWSPDGHSFVFAGVRNGRPVLSIMDTQKGHIVREIPFPQLGEIFNPTWSPDERHIAFSGLVGGLSDLYVYDLTEDVLERMTEDAYADLQPAWSPDGRTIAFVTDRFTTGLASLHYGNYRIGLLDVATGKMFESPGFPSGKHINPQWGADGRQIYFISDQNGISNVYRVDLRDESLYQITNLYTGASGITPLSPALSFSSESHTLAITVYEHDGYHIYIIDDPTVLNGTEIPPRVAAGDLALLAPWERDTSEVQTLRDNPFFGLPSDTSDYTEHAYRPGLGLDYVGQPSFIVGSDSYGTYIGGGGSAYFSDMLGNRQLGAAVQFQGGVRDISAAASYVNRSHRLNWGVTVQQAPFRTGSVGFDTATVQNLSTLVEETVVFRQVSRGLSTTVQYPFSRVRRLEGAVGYSNISFGIEDKQRFFAATGEQVYDTSFALPAPAGLNLGQALVATVYDNTIFGFTGPILGERYRLEVGNTFGSLNFRSALFDFRKYLMPHRPFTLAARIMHHGRYGPDAESSNALQPQFLGYDGLVRGYGLGSFDFYTECESQTSCPAYTNLFGSKVIVGNLELRLPPLGVLGIGGPFGALPIELLAFADGGLAWYTTPATDRAFFLSGGQRKPVFSTGLGLRANLMGILIVEADFVYPFNRPNKGTHFQFGFTPGF